MAAAAMSLSLNRGYRASTARLDGPPKEVWITPLPDTDAVLQVPPKAAERSGTEASETLAPALHHLNSDPMRLNPADRFRRTSPT